MKKIRVGSVCVMLIGAAVLAAAICGQEKKDNPAPPKIMHFSDLKWTPNQGMRSRAGGRRPERRRNAVCSAPPVR